MASGAGFGYTCHATLAPRCFVPGNGHAGSRSIGGRSCLPPFGCSAQIALFPIEIAHRSHEVVGETFHFRPRVRAGDLPVVSRMRTREAFGRLLFLALESGNVHWLRLYAGGPWDFEYGSAPSRSSAKTSGEWPRSIDNSAGRKHRPACPNTSCFNARTASLRGGVRAAVRPVPIAVRRNRRAF
jgi:hypothetical protein